MAEDLKGSENGGETPEATRGVLASKRRIAILILGVLVLIGVLWMVFGYFDRSESPKNIAKAPEPKSQLPKPSRTDAPRSTKPKIYPGIGLPASEQDEKGLQPGTDSLREAEDQKREVTQQIKPVLDKRSRGVAFVEASIKPLDYELNDRFWGWRPNDMVNFTDNVNNFQLGVLEVTRRTSVALAERISRTGSTESYVPELELAMNNFMVKPNQYWFPSAESKYQEGLDGLRDYAGMVETGEARFYGRVDNLLPLLIAYESLLGSCNENLVKLKDGGRKISWFKSDDFFYYSKGVASAMGTIFEAMAEDFREPIAQVGAGDILIEITSSLRRAAKIEPWIILEGSPGGIMANHRANMAAPISRARFYLNYLVTALTT